MLRDQNARREDRAMGSFTALMARDGHEFQAWLAPAQGPPRGAVVIVQEIFGVNAHIRSVTDSYAAAGYVAIAPCLFDRVRRGLELGYGPEDRERGIGTMKQIEVAKALKDIAACAAVVRHAGRTAVIGYCWGGTLAYLAARELPIACAVSYYGGGIAKNLERLPKKPVQYHFGEKDAHIPLSEVDAIRAADSRGTVYTYPADHGFNCEARESYDAPSARLARERTLAFLHTHLEQGQPAEGANNLAPTTSPSTRHEDF
jgi:carboxymethylenebutenolidase